MPAQKPSPEQQEAFDHLVAKGTKVLFNPEVGPKLVEAATSRGDIVTGLKSATEALINKMQEGAMQAERPIPKEMRPSLSLMMMTQLAELIEKETGESVPEEAIAEAMGYLSEDKFSESLQDGSASEEGIASTANEYGALARELNQGEQAMQQTTQTAPAEQVAQQRQGGLL